MTIVIVGVVAFIAGFGLCALFADSRRREEAAELAELDRVLAEHRERVGRELDMARYLQLRALERARPEMLN